MNDFCDVSKILLLLALNPAKHLRVLRFAQRPFKKHAKSLPIRVQFIGHLLTLTYFYPVLDLTTNYGIPVVSVPCH